MEIITLNEKNISSEHICCAISDKKCLVGYDAKKTFLMDQIKNGYVFKKLNVRGKVFIEYTPAEKAWAPVIAPGFYFISCFWVSGQYKGKGFGKQLYNECLKDAEKNNKNGIAVITGEKKRPFLSDNNFFKKMGFELSDNAPPYFQLWSLKLNKDAPKPIFKEFTKTESHVMQDGLTIFYSNGCPFTEFYVNSEMKKIAADKKIKLHINKLQTMEQAQNHIVPFTIYSVFYNGKFVTHEILNASRFDKFVSVNQA